MAKHHIMPHTKLLHCVTLTHHITYQKETTMCDTHTHRDKNQQHQYHGAANLADKGNNLLAGILLFQSWHSHICVSRHLDSACLPQTNKTCQSTRMIHPLYTDIMHSVTNPNIYTTWLCTYTASAVSCVWIVLATTNIKHTEWTMNKRHITECCTAIISQQNDR